MNFDLISTAELSAGAAIVSMTLVWIFARTLTRRSPSPLPSPSGSQPCSSSDPPAYLAPPASEHPPSASQSCSPSWRSPSSPSAPIAAATASFKLHCQYSIAIHALRALGFTFVVLYTAGRLPAPFAPAAGWGDIFIGVTALPLAWFISRNNSNGLAYSLLWLWNSLGVLDLVNAIALGATSSPGPIQLFHVTPNSSLMTTLPWIIIPCFLVPALAFLHIATFYRLRHLQPSTATAFATS